MKINVNTGKRTLKMRILSAFMAVLIFSLTFCNSWFVTKSNAKSDTTKISNSTKESYFTADQLNTGNNTPYRYTGRIKPVTVSMYDYLTDREQSNYGTGQYLQTNPDYNADNKQGYSWWRYYNPYNNFNKAVSDWANSQALTILSPSSQNITIEYYASNGLGTTNKVYLFNEGQEDSALIINMNISPDNSNKMTVTFPVSDLNGQTYSKLFFTTAGTTAGNEWSWGTHILNYTISSSNAGKKLYWERDKWNNDGEHTSCNTTNNGATFKSTDPEVGTAYDIESSALYTGFFIGKIDPAYNITEVYNSTTKPGTTSGAYNNGSDTYKKFYWSANIAPRGTNNTDSSIKGLVDSTLTGGVVSQGGRKLPYFYSSFNTDL